MASINTKQKYRRKTTNNDVHVDAWLEVTGYQDPINTGSCCVHMCAVLYRNVNN